MAGLKSSVGTDKATTWYCAIPSTSIAVSTEPAKTTAPPPVTTTSSAPYVTGTCDVHIYEFSDSYNSPLYSQLNITDGGNNLLASMDFTGKWGDSSTVPASDSKLPYDIVVDFLQTTKVPSKMARDKFKERMVGGGGTETVPWEDWKLTLTAGSTHWDDTDTSGMPYCSVGGWDNGGFGDWLDSLVTGESEIPVSEIP